MEKMMENHRDFFRDLFKLREGEQIPAHVIRLYETTRQLCDRKDVPMTDQLLVMIAMLSGAVLDMSNLVASIPRARKVAKPEQAKEATAAKPEEKLTAENTTQDPLQPKKFDGIPCEAFHNGETKSGVLLNIEETAKGMCSIVFAGDAEATLVDTNNVKVPDGEGKPQCLNQR